MFKLYQFYIDFGRMGEIEGLFIADEDAVKRSIGKHVHFGEVLGKHSDVSIVLEEDMFTEYFGSVPTESEVKDLGLSVVQPQEVRNQQAVDLFGVGSISGINPFNFLSDEGE